MLDKIMQPTLERQERKKPTIDVNPLDNYDTVRVNFPESSKFPARQITFEVSFPKSWDEVPKRTQPAGRKLAKNPYDQFLMSARDDEAFKACGGNITVLLPHDMIDAQKENSNVGGSSIMSSPKIAALMQVTNMALQEAYAQVKAHYLSTMQNNQEARAKAA